MKTIQILFLFIASVLVDAQDLRWQNEYDQVLNFTCPSSDSISYIMSQHNNHHEDRLWDFHCQPTFTEEPECFTTDWVNDFDEELDFKCLSNYVMTGMHSYHENYHEDRRWKFTCCTESNFCTGDCNWSGYVNDFDQFMSWAVPGDQYLAGAQSYHDDHHEDRQWQYLTCSKKC
ncbi:hemagglutinin/amebocyte aggregation factor-like [Engraulis encrasicolus]|uniref:hemagglutinin/amebocyte aggregation factor-like n=1 Tax=Engraulis encrasicolus TaxID=184585 RepID=UPI002FD6E35E